MPPGSPPRLSGLQHSKPTGSLTFLSGFRVAGSLSGIQIHLSGSSPAITLTPFQVYAARYLLTTFAFPGKTNLLAGINAPVWSAERHCV
jgi:hypothetical protein